jgi:hypothetical protein
MLTPQIRAGDGVRCPFLQLPQHLVGVSDKQSRGYAFLLAGLVIIRVLIVLIRGGIGVGVTY